MLSVLSPDTLTSDLSAPFSPFATLCRQMWLLHAKGRTLEASELQRGALPQLAAEIRAAHGEAALSETRMEEISAREQARVADAVAVAELVANLPSAAVSTGAAPTTASASARTEFRPVAAPERSHAPAAAPAIADLLDDMLSQEAAQRRPRSRAA